MFSMKLFILFAPEDAVIEAEHIKCRHCSNHCHNPAHYRTELEACCQYFIFREETGEWRNTCNGKTSNQERNMRHRHVLAQSTHSGHFIAVYRMDNATCAEEE